MEQFRAVWTLRAICRMDGWDWTGLLSLNSLPIRESLIKSHRRAVLIIETHICNQVVFINTGPSCNDHTSTEKTDKSWRSKEASGSRLNILSGLFSNQKGQRWPSWGQTHLKDNFKGTIQRRFKAIWAPDRHFLDGQLGPGSPTARGPICIEPQVNAQVLMKLFLPQNTCSIRKQLPQKDQEKKHNWHLRRMMSQVQPGQQFLGKLEKIKKKKHPVSDYFFDKLLSTSCCFLQNLRSW